MVFKYFHKIQDKRGKIQLLLNLNIDVCAPTGYRVLCIYPCFILLYYCTVYIALKHLPDRAIIVSEGFFVPLLVLRHCAKNANYCSGQLYDNVAFVQDIASLWCTCTVLNSLDQTEPACLSSFSYRITLSLEVL